jgi:hypothetical protein
MADPKDSPSGERPPESSVCEEIGRAVGSLRQRSSGMRPTSVQTEYIGDVVRCKIEEKDEATPEAASDETADEGSIDSAAGLGSQRYRAQAEAAVARLTKRKVVGFVTKAGADDETMNTFILEPIRTKY